MVKLLTSLFLYDISLLTCMQEPSSHVNSSVLHLGSKNNKYDNHRHTWTRRCCTWAVKIYTWTRRYCTWAVKIHTWTLRCWTWAEKMHTWTRRCCTWAVKIHTWTRRCCTWAVNIHTWTRRYCTWAVKITNMIISSILKIKFF